MIGMQQTRKKWSIYNIKQATFILIFSSPTPLHNEKGEMILCSRIESIIIRALQCHKPIKKGLHITRNSMLSALLEITY